MKLICPHCQHAVEYSGDCPRFCSFCGQSLSTVSFDLGNAATIEKPITPDPTGEFEGMEETLPPRGMYNDCAEETPQKVGDYQLLRRLGGGGMGSVFEAEDTNSGRRVAVKLIKPEFVLSRIAVERFRLEGRLASSIAHPRCVFVLAAEQEERQPYIVMELMPGSTLGDLVQERGPLPTNEAVAKILDVIEGLREAHRIGVIHRDVKPSNCFMDVDGRVKIGDFGLAKMAATDSDLTRTGTFIGTPLFSSPEQIKRMALTPQADIYSVCATLFYLLTGQAPFAGGDSLSAVARIVSEDPPSPRTLRPELSRSLERVILKGLAREPEDRWPDLDALHRALKAFLPGQVSRGSLGLRFGAYLLDIVFLKIIESVLIYGVIGNNPIMDPEQALEHLSRLSAETFGVEALLWLLYFGVLEGLTGWTLGKRLLRLRTCTVEGIDPPGPVRGIFRFLVFFNLIQLSHWVTLFLLVFFQPVRDPRFLSGVDLLVLAVFAALPNVAFCVALVLLWFRMRERNGYRGLHEFASKTRVVELPPPPRQQTFTTCQSEFPISRRPEMPLEIGPYAIDGVVQWTTDEQTLVGHDPNLGRRVWVWVRPVDAPPLDPRRRDLNRTSRLRHIASGVEENCRWEAFLAPTGTCLPDLARMQKRFPYADSLAIIEQLSDELARSCAEHTVPERLTPRQVFVDGRGHVQLLGTPLDQDDDPPEPNDEVRCLRLLRAATTLVLEGQPRGANAPAYFRAPIPLFARDVFAQLLDDQAPPRLEYFRDCVRDLKTRPLEVSRVRRFLHAAVTSSFSVGLFAMLFLAMQMVPSFILTSMTAIDEVICTNMEDRSMRQLAVISTQQNAPELILTGLATYNAEQKLLRERRDFSAVQGEWLKARQKWTFLPFGGLLRAQFNNTKSTLGDAVGRNVSRHDIWNRRQRPKATDLQVPPRLAWVLPSVVAVLWTLWAFATRGGVVLRLCGLDLVQADGRRAARWRHAARAALFWMPQILVLGGALWLDGLYWDRWFEPGWRESMRWLTYLSWPMWWLGIAMVSLAIGFTVWKPERAWHDRLIGTWVVPR